MPETRVSRLGEIIGEGRGAVTDVDGSACAVTVQAGEVARVVFRRLPARPDSHQQAELARITSWAGASQQWPGVVATTTDSPGGGRMLHLLNPTGYPAMVQVDMGDPTGLLDEPLLCPRRPAGCWGSGSSCPSARRWCRRMRRSPSWPTTGSGSLPAWASAPRCGCAPTAGSAGADARTEGDLTVVTGPAGADLVVTFD